MRATLLSVGRPRDEDLQRKVDDYGERLRRFGIAWETISVPEERPGGRFSDAHVVEREARALRGALPSRGTIVALDVRGRTWSSEELAPRVERWLRPHATFVVGGPLGLDATFVETADVHWSLSALTFPHELARVLVAEQIYRAVTIARNVPYHKA